MGHAGPPAGVGASGLGQNPTPMLKQPMVGMARMAAPPQTPAARKVVDISMLDRVRAVCCLLGVGDAGAMVNSKPGAMQAAVAAIKSGAAFRWGTNANTVTDSC
ncbi:unnamed protein product [Ostreobium quekettii]|uniref:Uncharacterized protein n=1 Tax=Ostreobium quekettii TaxID=121088 RepID=A0A8S1IX39_9CHLO|nr:unnamed protein product [Ostreobium quekettii]|eukprot:evm.model.scf_272.4 EVM.evm.TU.scf_272.4   scf_272:53271-54259(+)